MSQQQAQSNLQNDQSNQENESDYSSVIHSVMKWTATVCMILAAFLISVSPDLAANSAPTYSLFMIAHIIWAAYAIAMKEYSLLWMNVGLLPIDFYAIGIRL